MTNAPTTPRRVSAVSVIIPARNAATTIAKALGSLQSQRFAEAGRRIMLTFDDAYEDFGSTAWPLLQRYGFQAILFVVTGSVGKTNAWDPDS